MPLYGFDAVNVNTTSSAAFTDPFYRFCIVKSTEGMGWKNTASYYNLQKLARDNGKLFGAYHYGWTVQDPVAEANNFLGYSKLLPGDVAVLDIERQTEMPATTDTAAIKAWWQQVNAFAVTWLTEVGKALGVKPIVYINNYWRTNMLLHATAAQKAFLTSHPLWLSEPGANNTAKNPGNFTYNTEWGTDIHQYHFISGIDKNWYAHGEQQWQALMIPQPPVVIPPPTEFDQIMNALKANSLTLDGLTTKAGVILSNVKSNETKIDETKTLVSTTGTNVVAAVADDIARVTDAIAGQAVAVEETDLKLDALGVKFDSVALDINSLATLMVGQANTINSNIADLKTTVTSLDVGAALVGQFDELKQAINALPDTLSVAVGEALSGFSLTVSYPKRT